mgnify:FL=1
MTKTQKQYYLNHKKDYYERNVKRYETLKLWLKEYKSHLKCEVCGETHPATLDFHHKNPNEKDFNIARLTANRPSVERLQKEIEKCCVWCSNCHRKHHYLE